MSGLSIEAGIVDGLAGELGVREETAEDGHARLEFAAEHKHLNQRGHRPGRSLGDIGGRAGFGSTQPQR